MQTAELTRWQVVQLSPTNAKNPMLAACFMIVTEPKPWGAIGFIQCPGENGEMGGRAYYRATWEEMEPTGGEAPWFPADEP